MRVLAVKQPWASLIVEGKKTIEVRSRPTNIRGRVAIYASRSMYDELGFGIGYRPLPRGYIIGTVELVGRCFYDSGRLFQKDEDKHMIYCSRSPPEDYEGLYGWILENPKLLDNPIEYIMPRGCVVWANTYLL